MRMLSKTPIALSFSLVFSLTLQLSARAGSARFFRIAGPVPTTITDFTPDGYITWSNLATNATFTVQTSVLLSDASSWVDYIDVPATNAPTTEQLFAPNPPSDMVLIPAGTFLIGSSPDHEVDLVTNTVYISAFYMDRTVVTVDSWNHVFSWSITNGYSYYDRGFPPTGKGPAYPIGWVSWYMTALWCNARSQLEGLTLCYYTDPALTQPYTNGEVTPYVNWAANGYRLPTEAEWEKAARGGLKAKRFPNGDTISEAEANYYGNMTFGWDLGPDGWNAIFHTDWPWVSPVGYFPMNGYGVDVAGNVSEWVWDLNGGSYSVGSDPHGPDASLLGRVYRNGTFMSYATELRCDFRDSMTPASGCVYRGFRCVRNR